MCGISRYDRVPIGLRDGGDEHIEIANQFAAPLKICADTPEAARGGIVEFQHGDPGEKVCNSDLLLDWISAQFDAYIQFRHVNPAGEKGIAAANSCTILFWASKRRFFPPRPFKST